MKIVATTLLTSGRSLATVPLARPQFRMFSVGIQLNDVTIDWVMRTNLTRPVAVSMSKTFFPSPPAAMYCPSEENVRHWKEPLMPSRDWSWSLIDSRRQVFQQYLSYIASLGMFKDGYRQSTHPHSRCWLIELTQPLPKQEVLVNLPPDSLYTWGWICLYLSGIIQLFMKGRPRLGLPWGAEKFIINLCSQTLAELRDIYDGCLKSSHISASPHVQEYRPRLIGTTELSSNESKEHI